MKAHAEDVNERVGARMRERRIMLGMTQQQMAELIGVTSYQAHKYENGYNRITAGRLYTIAQVLGVEVSYFFTEEAFWSVLQERQWLDLARNFISMPSQQHQEAVCALARALAAPPE